MLETIREYALDRLDSAGETEEVSQIHGRYFLDQAIAVEPKLTTGTQTEALAVLEAEESNLRAALGWSLTRDQPDSLEKLRRISLVRYGAIGGCVDITLRGLGFSTRFLLQQSISARLAGHELSTLPE